MMRPKETPIDAAKRLSSTVSRSGYELQALHEYTDREGEPQYWRIRMKHPKTGEKWIRPMKLTADSYVLGEPEYPNGKPLYRLHELAARPDDPVIVAEGESCVDKLTSIGLLATTSGAADSAAKADWQPLAGRKVIIWPDNDDAGLRYAQQVAVQLNTFGCSVRVIDVAALHLEPKDDAVDWLTKYPSAGADDVLSLAFVKEQQLDSYSCGDQDQDFADGGNRIGTKSQATALVAFVEANAELFHDQNGDVYAQDRATGETRRIDGHQFRDWLVANFYKSSGASARDQSVREALSTLAGLARVRGECHDVHVRAAIHEGDYYLDLAEPGQSRAVRIMPGRWEIVTDPPVRFIRPATIRPLPEPLHGGDLTILWRLVNIPEDAQLLVLAWLGECIRPDTPFPILELIGEQGSAKSTTQAILRQLLDPNACNLRAAPKTVEDVFVCAGMNWLTSYENISHLSPPMQDALCVLATGGGFAKRKLYSDADEAVVEVKRPVILNGISAAVTAQDLIDRTVSIEVPMISRRVEITSLSQTFGREHGKLLGVLLDVVADALARLPDIHLPPENQPRLIEFARFGMAIAQAVGRPGEDFMVQFMASRQEAISRTIDACPVALALIDWFEARGRCTATLSAKDLFHAVEQKKPSSTDAWPRSAKGFADALRRVAPALRQMGIECRCLGKIGGNVLWHVSSREIVPDQCPACPDVSPAHLSNQDIRTSRTSRTSRTLSAELSLGESGDDNVEVTI